MIDDTSTEALKELAEALQTRLTALVADKAADALLAVMQRAEAAEAKLASTMAGLDAEGKAHWKARDELRAALAQVETLREALEASHEIFHRLTAIIPSNDTALSDVCAMMRDIRAALAATPAPEGGAERVRHIKRGSTYRVLHRGAELQAATDVIEGMPMVVYRCETDGRVWVRAEHEFDDGRFEPLPAPPVQTTETK